MRTSRRTFTAAAVAAGVIITGLSVVAGGAGAYGGETGQLLIKGPGSAYTAANSNSYATTLVAIETTAGATASFGLEVKNTSASTEQYNLTVETGSYSCAPPSCSQPPTSVSAGSLVLTPLTAGPNGYFTAPIAPGKTAAYTVKVTIPKGTNAGGTIATYVDLWDTAHNHLAAANLRTNLTEAKGIDAATQLVSGSSGQKPMIDTYQLGAFVSNPAIKLGGTSVFTVKLENDSASSAQITEKLVDYSTCGGYFPIKVKAGTSDVTALALAGTYVTPVLAPGKSTTLTATVTFASTPVGCTYNSDIWESESTVGSTEHDVFLVTNASV